VTIYFVTGTDTGAGKTYVSAALLRRARELGKRTFGFKPIETGCTDELGPDQQVLREAAGGWQQGSLCGLYRFRDPVAPLVAAKAEGTEIDLTLVIATARETAATVSFSVVEGAGDWRVPVTPSADMASLALQLGAPVVVAARAGLGTINHTLLTLEAVERDGCSVAAAILSRRPEDDVGFAEQNAAEIRRRWPGRVMVLAADLSGLDPLI